TSNRGVEVRPRGPGAKADLPVSRQNAESPMFGKKLMEEICERDNLRIALERVKRNKGCPGVDDMTVDELPGFLRDNWQMIKVLLLNGEDQPQPVKRVKIPKPGCKDKRKLSIPCVLDRFIQQAILQTLQGKWDKTFSEYSYRFRPDRSAHEAVAKAQSYVKDGYNYVVDIDLEKFFDRVNHDRLMSKLSGRIADKRVLKLIRSYLRTGVLEDGLVSVPTEGTLQGGPLSPILSNIVLDELDKELEKRGHKFVRYADDSNIYVRSKRAGERVMRSMSNFIISRLKLKVNRAKSTVGVPQGRKFLGFILTGGKYPNRLKISSESIKRFRAQVRKLTRRNCGISIEGIISRLSRYIVGWRGYYGYCEAVSVLRDLDSWLRRRLRCVQWKQWKIYKRRMSELIRFGVNEELA
ncbi:MAG: group II intron reverse transcriptase/maturase, partial [Candidatus Scalindua sp.]